MPESPALPVQVGDSPDMGRFSSLVDKLKTINEILIYSRISILISKFVMVFVQIFETALILMSRR